MSMIEQNGVRWKDTVPGIWDGITEWNGVPMWAYAIEVETTEDDEQCGVTEEGRSMLINVDSFASLAAGPWPTFKLGGDIDCVLVLLPRP